MEKNIITAAILNQYVDLIHRYLRYVHLSPVLLRATDVETRGTCWYHERGLLHRCEHVRGDGMGGGHP